MKPLTLYQIYNSNFFGVLDGYSMVSFTIINYP